MSELILFRNTVPASLSRMAVVHVPFKGGLHTRTRPRSKRLLSTLTSCRLHYPSSRDGYRVKALPGDSDKNKVDVDSPNLSGYGASNYGAISTAVLLDNSNASLNEPFDKEEAGVDDFFISEEVAAEVNSRLQRLEALVLLRRLYRDMQRSEGVLRMPIPRIAVPKQGSQELLMRRRRRGVNYWVSRGLGVPENYKEVGGEEEEAPRLLVESAVEVLECADDVRSLGHSLRLDVARVRGRLGVLFPVSAMHCIVLCSDVL